MPYRLNIQDDLDANMRRIVGQQINRAIKALSNPSASPIAIHETRKCMKRIRALLKLLRPGLGRALYGQENKRFRDISALLSAARDTDCLDQAVVNLCSSKSSQSDDALAQLRIAIHAQRMQRVNLDASAITQAQDHLSDAVQFYKKIQLIKPDCNILLTGLQSCYQKARKAQKKAYRTGDDEAFHEWRKPVQLHWRQMKLFSQAWPAMFQARVEMARTLSQYLGDDHDISVLLSFAETEQQDGRLNKPHLHEIEKICKIRQEILRRTARPLGEILFLEPAKLHAKRIFGIWSASAHMETNSNASQADAGVRREDLKKSTQGAL